MMYFLCFLAGVGWGAVLVLAWVEYKQSRWLGGKRYQEFTRTEVAPAIAPTIQIPTYYRAEEKGEILHADLKDFLEERGDKLKIDDLLK